MLTLLRHLIDGMYSLNTEGRKIKGFPHPHGTQTAEQTELNNSYEALKDIWGDERESPPEFHCSLCIAFDKGLILLAPPHNP